MGYKASGAGRLALPTTQVGSAHQRNHDMIPSKLVIAIGAASAAGALSTSLAFATCGASDSVGAGSSTSSFGVSGDTSSGGSASAIIHGASVSGGVSIGMPSLPRLPACRASSPARRTSPSPGRRPRRRARAKDAVSDAQAQAGQAVDTAKSRAANALTTANGAVSSALTTVAGSIPALPLVGVELRRGEPDLFPYYVP